MKHLKTQHRELRLLFENVISVGYITESLASFEDTVHADVAKRFLEEKDYDVIGVRKNGYMIGYAKKKEIHDGYLGDFCINFDKDKILHNSSSMLSALAALKSEPQVFVEVFGNIAGIATRGDLQKAPMRMWLFSLTSLIEMHMLRLVRKFYEDNSWTAFLPEKRLDASKRLQQERVKRNEDIDLADCLQFCDKRHLILINDEFRAICGFNSIAQGDDFLKKLENLRNRLAHSQDILSGNFHELAEAATKGEGFLKHLEAIAD